MHAILLIFKAVKHQYNLKYFINYYHYYNEHFVSKFWQVRNLRLPFHLFVRLSVCLFVSRYRSQFLAATKQLYDWFSPSVCLSVCPSVRPSVTPFSPCSYHRIIMKFSGLITVVRSDVHAKGEGQRSKVKVTEVNTQLSRFRTLTPV